MIRSFCKATIFPVLLLLVVGSANAQNNMPFSQFYANKTMLNPAAAGLVQDQINIALFARKEWTSFPGAPQSNLFIADIPINHNSMGLGMKVFQENIVVNNNWDAHLLYSYKINLNKGKLAFGINAGMAQYNFNSSNLAIRDSDDKLLSPVANGKIYPDLGFGLLYSKKSFLLGFSAANMLKHPNNVFNPLYSKGNVKPDFTGFISQKWALSSDWELETLLMGNYWNNQNTIITGSLVMGYKKGFMFGGNYKSTQSAAAIIALRLDRISAALEKCTLGYSYDINLSNSNIYLNNTHEFTLSIKFDKPKSLKKESQKPEEISPYDL